MKNEQAHAIRERTFELALRVIRLCDSLPRTRSADVIARQLLRSAASVGANYRAACRARSKPDFISKLGIVEEKVDETLYWMELLIRAGLVKKDRLETLMGEADEITAIVVASIRTARARR